MGSRKEWLAQSRCFILWIHLFQNRGIIDIRKVLFSVCPAIAFIVLLVFPINFNLSSDLYLLHDYSDYNPQLNQGICTAQFGCSCGSLFISKCLFIVFIYSWNWTGNPLMDNWVIDNRCWVRSHSHCQVQKATVAPFCLLTHPLVLPVPWIISLTTVLILHFSLPTSLVAYTINTLGIFL